MGGDPTADSRGVVALSTFRDLNAGLLPGVSGHGKPAPGCWFSPTLERSTKMRVVGWVGCIVLVVLVGSVRVGGLVGWSVGWSHEGTNLKISWLVRQYIEHCVIHIMSVSGPALQLQIVPRDPALRMLGSFGDEASGQHGVLKPQVFL